jgi:histidine phosphotransferase ChpT
MTVDAVEFASLLCSRLCHDLLSPVGALNNGVELLADEQDPVMRDQVVQLLGDSARSTAEKLKFFRLAFGAAGGFGDQVDAREAKLAIEGIFGANGRITLGWLVTEHSLAKPAIKVLLNLALIAGDALVRGGQLDVGAEVVGNRTDIVIRAEGPRLILDPELRAALTGQVDERTISSRSAAAYLAYSITKSANGAIQVSQDGETQLVFGASLTAA